MGLAQFCSVFLVIPLLLGSCKLRQFVEAESSDANLSSLADCHVKEAYKQGFNVCIDNEGIDGAVIERVRNYVASGLQAWLKPLRIKNPEVTEKISFQCDEPTITVFVLPDQEQGFAGCGVLQIPSSLSEKNPKQKDLKLAAEILHLLGIAIGGLKPTYETYGQCLSDQPQSIMCYAAQSSRVDEAGTPMLYQEDEQLILSQYQAIK